MILALSTAVPALMINPLSLSLSLSDNFSVCFLTVADNSCKWQSQLSIFIYLFIYFEEEEAKPINHPCSGEWVCFHYSIF